MIENRYAISLKTNRLVKKSTSNYKKLKKLGLVKEIDEDVKVVKPEPESEDVKPEPVEEPKPEPEFNELDLQIKMAELTTDMVADNVKKIIKSQSLSDKDYDTLLKKMLFQKLCVDKPSKPEKKKEKKEKKPKKKKKFKIVEPSSSEGDSESD